MQHTSSRVFFPIAVLLGAFVAPGAGAQPAAPSGRGPDRAAKADAKADKAAERADAKAAKADARADKAAEKADARADKAAEKAEKTDATKGEGEHGRGPGEPPGHGAHGPGPGGFRGLGEDFQHGRVKKAELKERLLAMHEKASERRRAHQGELKNRWGAVLAHPSCREELRHHARREAFLSRAYFLAQTEIVKDKDKVLERIEKLIAKEEARHARAMERLKSMPTAPGSGAAPSANPTPSASAPKAGGQ